MRGPARQWAHSGIGHQLGRPIPARPAHVDQLSGRGRPLRNPSPAELRRPASGTYDFRPADRTDDYSASDSAIPEALQQTAFDGIRHAVSRVGVSGRNRTQLRIRGIVGAVPTINTTLGACEGLDVVAVH